LEFLRRTHDFCCAFLASYLPLTRLRSISSHTDEYDLFSFLAILNRLSPCFKKYSISFLWAKVKCALPVFHFNLFYQNFGKIFRKTIGFKCPSASNGEKIQ